MWVIVLKWILYVVAASLACFTVGWLGREIFRALFGLSSTRRDELLRIFLVLTGILVTLSLLSFDPKDYTTLDLLSFDVHDTVSNKGGVIGAILSLWLYMGLGPSSLMIPVVLLLWGILPRRFYQILPMRTAFLLGVAVLVSFIVAGLPQTGAGSSIIGDKLSTAGSQYLGVGKWLVAAAFVFGLCLTFPGMRGLVSGIPAWIGRLTSGIGSLRKPKIISEEPEPELVKEEIEEEKEPEIVKSEPVSHEIEKPQQELPVEESPPALDASEFKALFLDSLKEPESVSKSESESELKDRAKVLEQKFEQFAISGEITKIAPGPVITRYEYKPAPGIKLSRIAGLSDDIALSMKSTRIRIVAPIPGKSVIGIEVPNQDRECVYLKQVLTSPIFESLESKLGVVLGSDIAGEPVCDDIAGFPHLLIAGTTGSGKSVCVNTMIASILYRATPQDVRFLMIDPKRLELRVYNGIPHLVRPVISDSKESLEALKKALLWMEIRYKEFARVGVRDIQGYNERVDEPKPYILVIIDELADLMITAPRDIEAILTRLAQMSRAVGIHLVLATQRPSVDIITGLIKANFPARVAFQVASKTDSRTILDMNGAEKLLGKGDMLFLPPGKGTPERLHGAFIDTQESKRIADLWTERRMTEVLTGKIDDAVTIAKELVKDDLIESLVEKNSFPGAKERIDMFAQRMESEHGIPGDKLRNLLLVLPYYPRLEEEIKTIEVERPVMEEEITTTNDVDELFDEARALVVRHQTASVSLFQRHFKIGYARAGRIVDQLERAGVIGPYVGSKSRDVLAPRDI